MQAFMLQQKLRNQQQRQVLQSIPQFLEVPTQQQLVRHHLQQPANHQVSAIHTHDAGIYSRRLMQYIYHLRYRPSDNSIAYWRKFVSEYYAPGAKKSWCLSLYNSIGEHALGVFSQAAMERFCSETKATITTQTKVLKGETS
ncbi:putative transcriptional regulator SLK3 [Camellia lanceoleosa]|uniref:Transcriptional regulator SLK3 n=1 Tax=Camellia lanceoleosa TaxID=1840588 RepID=A0ACC0I535_9ERIC|nr:putative transcriptional regulator SLK3 [Camellia lanceoleosa]